ncbi:MAG TPA: NAD(P)-binding domain-containing protein, partial [Vicinamibacterales bacterium]
MADSILSQRPAIGFIGLGGMGSRMAARLLAAGYQVAIYDRNPSRAEALRGGGAQVAESPRDVAASSDIVLSSLTDDTAVADVMYGEHG